MRAFQSLLEQLEALGARVAGVSADSFAANKAFAAHCEAEFPLLSDWPRFRTIQAFGVQAEDTVQAFRSTFVFDEQGVCRYAFADLAQAEDHATDALAAVRELVSAQA